MLSPIPPKPGSKTGRQWQSIILLQSTSCFDDIFSDVRTTARDIKIELDLFEAVSFDSSEATGLVVAARLELLKKDGNGTDVALY